MQFVVRISYIAHALVGICQRLNDRINTARIPSALNSQQCHRNGAQYNQRIIYRLCAFTLHILKLHVKLICLPIYQLIGFSQAMQNLTALEDIKLDICCLSTQARFLFVCDCRMRE